MAATCMAVCKGSRKKIRGIFISSCHLPVAVECDIVILSEPGPIPQAPVGQFCRHNLSPRGDGNHLFAYVERGFLRHNLSPRGDGNCPGCVSACGELLTQLIPARGRKRVPAARNCDGKLTQLIPARGRKLRRIGRSSRVPRHNLSPRGDGNFCLRSFRSAWERDTTYPREGTETPFTEVTPASLAGHNLSPRGDGNLLLLCSSVFAVEPDTTYPREGTETF